MKWKDKLIKKKQELSEQYQRGKIVTEQIRAEKLRKKGIKKSTWEPGMFRYGLAVKQHPVDFMKDVKERRVRKRKEKKQQKTKE